jgi:hypothetical protein
VSRARTASAVLVLLAGCAAGELDEAPEVAPDSLLAEALVTLHLADARAEADSLHADSLRAAAYAAVHRTTGLDSAAVAARLAAAVRRPDEAAALYRLVAEQLEAMESGGG